MTGSEGREHGDGDQLGGAEAAHAQVCNGGADDGRAEENRADHPADLRDGGADLEPFDDEGVENEEQARERLLEADGRVAVIVTAA